MSSSPRVPARASRAALAVAALVGAASPGASRASPQGALRAEALESARDFAGALAPLGQWIALAGGVRAWRPERVGVEWCPYRDGHWSWTAEGWFWVSSEPWAWATYHFGRWRFDPANGWVWLPGDSWAPSRVVWRIGVGVVGWAPATDDGFVLPGHWTFLASSRFVGGDGLRDAIPAPRVPRLLAATRMDQASTGPSFDSAAVRGATLRTSGAAVRAPRSALAASRPPPFATAN